MIENLTKSAVILATFAAAVAAGEQRAWLDEVWGAIRDWRRQIGL